METKHTKGEWTVKKQFKNPIFCRANNSVQDEWQIISENNDIIACVGYQSNKDVVIGVHDFDEAEANAKLIAAAPELLEALIEAKKIVSNKDLHSDFYLSAIGKINNAIKKATE